MPIPKFLRPIFEAVEGLTDDAIEALMLAFKDAPDTAATRRAAQQAAESARLTASSFNARATVPAGDDLATTVQRMYDEGASREEVDAFMRQNNAVYSDPAAADTSFAARIRRQPSLEVREVPQSLEARKRERPRVEALTVETTPNRVVAPEVSIYDYEGRPFITSMSDLSAAGDEITAINDVPLSMAVQRQGGQDYMFDNPDAVWAADRGNAAAHMGLAARLRDETGQDPIFMPWAMGAKAIDFSHMPRELMLQYAAAQRGRRGRNTLSRDIRDIMPDFRDVDDPASLAVFQGATGRQRGALNRLLDQMRDEGGMGIGSARLAMSDTEQLGAPLTSLRNVGLIDTRGALGPSAHPSYNTAVPGTGLGRLRESIGVLEVLPELARGLNDPFAFPVGVVPGRSSPLRSLQMKPRGGILTEDILRAIESRQRALEQGDLDFAVRR